MISSSKYHKRKQYFPKATANYFLNMVPSKFTALSASKAIPVSVNSLSV